MLNLLPDSVWAMLVHGREAVSPSVSLVCDDDAHAASGIGFRNRWRGYDGETCWPWGNGMKECPQDGTWRVHFAQWLDWVRTDDKWRPGAWKWGYYDRDRETDFLLLGRAVSRGQMVTSDGTGPGLIHIPDEILLQIAHQLESTQKPVRIDSLFDCVCAETTVEAVATGIRTRSGSVFVQGLAVILLSASLSRDSSPLLPC